MATGGVERINNLVGRIVSRAPRAGSSDGTDFRGYLYDAYQAPARQKQDRGDSVDISRDANKLARYAQELQEIRASIMTSENRAEFVADGNPMYLEDTARAYNILRARVSQRLLKFPAALNADIEILNVVLERSLTEEARELAQSGDVYMFTAYITHGESMLRERLMSVNTKYLKSFFYLLNTMEPDRAEASASELLRKTESASLEQLSYSDIARMKEFGRHNKSMSLAAKWNMLSRDEKLSPPLRRHFAMLYKTHYGVKSVNKAAAQSAGFSMT